MKEFEPKQRSEKMSCVLQLDVLILLKWSYSPKSIYKLQSLSKYPFFKELEKNNTKIYIEPWKIQNLQEILRKKDKAGSISLPLPPSRLKTVL